MTKEKNEGTIALEKMEAERVEAAEQSGKKLLNESQDKDILNRWYVKAKEQTMETLPEFMRCLMEDYQHDYGTICHAIGAIGAAAAWAANHHPSGNITGFQAGAVTWQFMRGWSGEESKTGKKLVNYDDMLYPQYEEKFEKTIGSKLWENLQKEAKARLTDYEAKAENIAEGEPLPIDPTVTQHWESIAAGKVPFGFTVKD